jgi:hypothetical protein
MSDKRTSNHSNIDKEFSQIKLDSVKNFVDNHLEKLGLYDKIKGLININESMNEQELMERIKESGLIDEVLEKIQNSEVQINNLQDRFEKKCLYLKLISGKGFIDYAKNKNSDRDVNSDYFQFDILFFGQRYTSKKISYSSEFIIDQSFLLDYNPLKLDLEINLNLLKKISSPIHLVLSLVSEDGDSILVATKSIEWRWTLCYGSWKVDVELYSPNTLNKLNVGTIEIQFSLMPTVKKIELINERFIFEQLNDEKKLETESKSIINF